jgi:hypothetical protein
VASIVPYVNEFATNVLDGNATGAVRADVSTLRGGSNLGKELKGSGLGVSR